MARNGSVAIDQIVGRVDVVVGRLRSKNVSFQIARAT